MATDYRKDSIGYQQLEDFARILQEKSQNTIVVSLYGSGEWSQAYSFVDYIKLGSLEMACLKPAEMIRLQPAYELYQQPYLFTSLQAVESYISGDAAKKHCRHCLLSIMESVLCRTAISICWMMASCNGYLTES